MILTKITLSKELTINLGNYENVKLSMKMEVDPENSDHEEVTSIIKEIINNELFTEAEKILPIVDKKSMLNYSMNEIFGRGRAVFTETAKRPRRRV